MSAMDKNPPMNDISSCGSLQDAPYDLGRATCLQNGPAIKIERGWGGKREGAGRKPKSRIIQRATGPRWYAFKVQPSKIEAVVRDLLDGETRPGYLKRQPFRVYVPQIAVEVVRKGVRLTVPRNMFVGYGLVYFNHLVDHWSLIREVSGVVTTAATPMGIFTTQSINPETGYVTPIPLPEGEVEDLIEEEPERLKLPKVRLPAYEPGQALRFESGPFAGHLACCIACDGLTTRVFVQMFKERELQLIRPRSELRLVEADRRLEHDRPG